MNKLLQLKLSPIEMTYLARLIGADGLFGIGDPFFGWLTEEIREAWEGTHKALEEKGVLRQAEDGRLVVDMLAGGALAVCAKPDASFLVSNRRDGEDEQPIVFHKTAGLCVEHPLTYEPNVEISLLLYESPRVLAESIVAGLSLGEGNNTGEGTIRTTMGSLWIVVERAEKGGENMGKVLAEVEIKGQLTDKLEETLSSSFYMSSLLKTARRGEDWSIEGLAFLGSEDWFWIIEPDMRDKDISVSISPTSPEEARVKALGLIGE
jgi:hypothetical protein